MERVETIFWDWAGETPAFYLEPIFFKNPKIFKFFRFWVLTFFSVTV